MGLLFRAVWPPKISEIPKILKTAPAVAKDPHFVAPGLQNVLKIMIFASQNLENPIAKQLVFCILDFRISGKQGSKAARVTKNGTVAGYARSALDIYCLLYTSDAADE